MQNSSIRIAFLLMIAAFSLWLKAGMPAFAISNAGHDDLLFVRQAYALGSGNWLGPYNNLTHAKGMFYPLFVLLAFATNLPLKIAEQALYLGASGLTSWMIARLSRSHRLGLVCFVALALNPVLWHPQLARVIREGIYISETLAIVSLSIALVALNRPLGPRSSLASIVLPFTLGLLGGAFWLTREEGIWLLPVLGLAVAILAAYRIIGCKTQALRPRVLSSVGTWGLLSSLVLIGFLLPIGTVSFLNWITYGVYRTNDFRSDDFLAAYGALTRIQHDEWRPYVVWPKDARERAYSVSPAARELAAAFEGPIGEGWRQAGCQQTRTEPCPEILAGWFMWALRDATAQAGHYRSAPAARLYYLRLAQEVNEACDRAEIPCLAARATLVPPLRVEYVVPTLEAAAKLVAIAITMGRGEIGSPPSSGPAHLISYFESLVGVVSPPIGLRNIRIRGWVAAHGDAPRVLVQTSEGTAIAAPATTEPAPDAEAVNAGMKALRFTIEAICPSQNCSLVLKPLRQAEIAIPIHDLKVGALTSKSDIAAFIEAVGEDSGTVALKRRQALQTAIARIIAFGYAVLTPVLFVAGLVGVLIAVVRGTLLAAPAGLVALTAASLAAVTIRIALLAFLEATAIPSVNVLYFSPASPFVLLFGLLGSYLGWKGHIHRRVP
jgi:hypothetical protein